MPEEGTRAGKLFMNDALSASQEYGFSICPVASTTRSYTVM